MVGLEPTLLFLGIDVAEVEGRVGTQEPIPALGLEAGLAPLVELAPAIQPARQCRLEVLAGEGAAGVVVGSVMSAVVALQADAVRGLDVLEVAERDGSHSLVAPHLVGGYQHGLHPATLTIVDVHRLGAEERRDGDSLMPADALATAAVVREHDFSGAPDQQAEFHEGSPIGPSQHGGDSIRAVLLGLPGALEGRNDVHGVAPCEVGTGTPYQFEGTAPTAQYGEKVRG